MPIGTLFSSSAVPDLAAEHPALLVCHSVKHGKAQELETTKSGSGDADENIAGDNA